MQNKEKHIKKYHKIGPMTHALITTQLTDSMIWSQQLRAHWRGRSSINNDFHLVPSIRQCYHLAPENLKDGNMKLERSGPHSLGYLNIT